MPALMNLNTGVMQFLWEGGYSLHNSLVYFSRKVPHLTRWKKYPYAIDNTLVKMAP